ncbi:DUF4330 domain-containing protein [Peptoniphilus sp. KCTC 25270]|uniref:DUF4330 domain-containing protein n=1 Tax=Peptoniphilus sp. KCTC 25270 TaxID=2897414 RepID=UPI001E4DABED|nr:DUF4330 domain-containing protein [Peptoniphilus sp. KCTC 25270]MCD1146784.1 DUF4330 domain-containing protein [Peptoniphilus sp. KCTC 25270]
MQLMDKKGKLFGIVNIIDLLFVLILIVAIVGGITRFKDTSVVAESTGKGKVTMMVADVRSQTVENIREGQELYHYDKGVYMGKISKVEVTPYLDKVEGNGEWIQAEVPDKYTIFIELDVDVTETDKSYVVGGEEIRVGVEYRVKSKTSAFTGVVVGINVEE